MAGLTAELYAKYKPIVDSGKAPEGMSPEYFSALQKAVDDYKSDFTQRWGTTQPPSGKAAVPGELGVQSVLGAQRGHGFEPLNPAAKAIENQLNPDLPLVPQALAMQPGTTHPGGDQAAKDEWLRQPGGDPTGSVVVYDMPLAKAREKLMDHPEMLPALGYPDVIPTPDELLQLNEKSGIYQALNDYEWRQAADAAAKSGQTAYRYSKAPWLQGESGGIMNPLKTLGMKLSTGVQPAAEGLRALVLGVDNYATLGSGRSVGERSDRMWQRLNAEHGMPGAPPPTEGGDKVVGGLGEVGGDQAAQNASLVEDNPLAYHAGQGIGMLAPWSPANRAWNMIASGGEALLPRVAANAFGRIGLAGASSAVAGGALHLGQEGIEAANQYDATGSPGTTAGEVLDRTGDAAVGAGVAGMGLQTLGQLAGSHREWTRGPEGRYGGAPERIEQAGGRFQFGKGPVAPAEYVAAQKAARAEGIGGSPEQIIADQLTPTMTEGARAVHGDARAAVAERKNRFYPTDEGQEPLPVQTLVTKARDLLDKHHAPSRGELRPVGTPDAGDNVFDALDANIEGVSLVPVEGAVPFSAKQAARYLSPERQQQLLEMRAPERPATAEPFRSETAGPGGRIEPTRTRTIEGEPQPPNWVETVTPGVGPWRPSRVPVGARNGIGETDRIVPHQQVDANPRLENSYKQRDLRVEAAERAQRPAGLRGHREAALGGPPEPNTNPEAVAKAPAPESPRKLRKPAEVRKAREQTVARAQDVETHLANNGVSTVYVIPRKYNARHTDQAIENIRRRGAGGGRAKGTEKSQPDRDMAELQDALYADRQQRAMGGKKGGWSEERAEQQRMVAKAQDTRERVLPKSAETGPKQTAHNVLVNYARTDDLPTIRAVREVAKRQGIEQEVEQLRLADALTEMKRKANLGRAPNGSTPDLSQQGSVFGRGFDFANLRFGYPLSNALASRLSPLGAFAQVGMMRADDPADIRRRASEESQRQAYSERRQAELDRRAEAAKPKRKRPKKKVSKR